MPPALRWCPPRRLPVQAREDGGTNYKASDENENGRHQPHRCWYCPLLLNLKGGYNTFKFFTAIFCVIKFCISIFYQNLRMRHHLHRWDSIPDVVRIRNAMVLIL